MEPLLIEDKKLKISVAEGLLSVVGQSDTYLIQEASMNNYEMFYKAYILAFLPCKDTNLDFIELWCWNPDSRKLICDALKHLGFHHPEDLTPAQLQALLLTYEGGSGLIFQLHNTYPKLQGGWEMAQKTMKNTVSNPRHSIFSRWQSFFYSVKTWLICVFISLYPGL